MQKRWTDSEMQQLKEYIDDALTVKEISEKLCRSKSSVYKKIDRLSIEVNCLPCKKRMQSYRNWTNEDDLLLEEMWYDGTYSNIDISKKLNRPWGGVKKRVTRLGLGERVFDTSYLSIPDIVNEMSVSKDSVSNWLQLGLKVKKKRVGRYVYHIKAEHLLDFLEKHPHLYNASLISEYLFVNEPEWLVQKRLDDKNIPKNNAAKYTNEEDKEIQRLFMKGVDDKGIAYSMGRSADGIRHRRWILGLLRE